MTEVDYSPEAYRQYQRTQQRITNWADDTAHCAPQYKSPFAPRSDVQSNAFYKSRSASLSRSPAHSRSPPPSGHHTPQRSTSRGYPPQAQAGVRSPRRSHTIPVDLVSPNDSVSQVSGPSHQDGHRRARSHSPSRHSSSRSSRSHRSHRPTTYVVSPTAQYGGMQYVQAPQPMQYVQQQPQPAAYVVYPRDRKVQIVYPEQAQYPPVAHATQEHHGGLLQRIFGSQSGKHGRSRSVSVPRSASRR